MNTIHFGGPMMNQMKSSWEEQAFSLEWPPRSYSCTFCKREFRSAQALGGHMNVHRRDRARLKLSLPSQNEVAHQETHNPSQVCCKIFNLHDPIGNPSHLGLSPRDPTLKPDWKTEGGKGARKDDFLFLGHDGCGESNLSMGLNLVISPNQPYGFDVDEVITSHKRHKTTTVSSSIQNCFFQSEVLGLKTAYLEELDLELRLGDPPKTK